MEKEILKFADSEHHHRGSILQNTDIQNRIERKFTGKDMANELAHISRNLVSRGFAVFLPPDNNPNKGFRITREGFLMGSVINDVEGDGKWCRAWRLMYLLLYRLVWATAIAGAIVVLLTCASLLYRATLVFKEKFSIEEQSRFQEEKKTEPASVLSVEPEKEAKEAPPAKPKLEDIKPLKTGDWKIYTNKNFGFKTKYPDGWYFDDYSVDFKRLVLGFYPNGKKRGYEYLGDVELSASENVDAIIDNIKKIEGTEEKTTDKGYPMLVNQDIPGNIDHFSAVVNCGSFVVSIRSPFGQVKEVAMQMANEVVCR